MRKGTLIFLLGIGLTIIPYLGIPNEWKQVGTVVCGVLLILFGYAIRRSEYLRDIDNGNGEKTAETFVEATPELFK